MKESETKDQIINRSTIKIRPMKAEDVVEASLIEAEVFSMPWKAEDFLEMVEAPYAYYFVAVAAREVGEEARETAGAERATAGEDLKTAAIDRETAGAERKVATAGDGPIRRIVGIIGLRDIAGEGEIANVAVKSEYRGLGIGRRLVEKVLDQCGQLKITDVTLEVRASNQVAINLYESVGFKGEGYRPNFYEHPVEDALIMWKH